MREEFKAVLRNVIRFMNSENVEIDEKIIKQFYDEFPFGEPEPAYGRALEELDQEIWAAIEEVNPTRLIDGVNASIKGDAVSISPKCISPFDRLKEENMENTFTWKLCDHIVEIMMNRRQVDELEHRFK